MKEIEKKRNRGKPAKKRREAYQEYNHEEVFDAPLELSEYMIEHLLSTRRLNGVYATKEVKVGEWLEVEVYPDFTRAQLKEAGIRPTNRKKQREAQKALNDRNSRKRFRRLAEHNFHDGDLWITLTYADENLPESMEAAVDCIQKFIKNVNGKRKRRGMPNAKYIYVTECVDRNGEVVRVHHHLIMDSMMDMQIVEATWKYGRRNECRKIKKDGDGIAGAAEYMVKKKPNGVKKYFKTWNKSKNLEEPPEHKHHRTRKTAINKMAKDHEYVREYMEKVSQRYKGYSYVRHETFYNAYNAGYYFLIRMRRRDQEP